MLSKQNFIEMLICSVVYDRIDIWFLSSRRNTDTSLHEKIVANVGQFASAFAHFDLHAALKKFPCL